MKRTGMSNYYKKNSNFGRVNYRRLSKELVDLISRTLESITTNMIKVGTDEIPCDALSYFKQGSVRETLESFGSDYNEREAYVKDFFKEANKATEYFTSLEEVV